MNAVGRVLEGLEPGNVWSIFEEITRIPRCSKKEQQLQQWLKTWASENGVEYEQDTVGNVRLTRRAAPGKESAPTLILQAHQDMVCEKTPESSHCFDTDPVPVAVKDGQVYAEGTSLGADNGVGMAVAMALVSDTSVSGLGAVEAVFTVDEEAGFTGIRNMKPSFFTGKHMINLDSEEEGVIIISSAGGGGTEYSIPPSPEPAEGWEALRVEVSGLMGGHSGVDIHLPRFNANLVLATGLRTLGTVTGVRIIDISGGTRGNAIPRDAAADILVPKAMTDAAFKTLDEWARGLDRSHETGLTVRVKRAEPRDAAPVEASAAVIRLVSEFPQGVYSWSTEYDGLVQTSNNLGIVNTDASGFHVRVFSRTSDAEDFKVNMAELKAHGEKYGAETVQSPGSAGWRENPESPFLALVEECYEEAWGKPAVTGIHGGLECGVFKQLDPELQIVSIGPTIKHPHSPNEIVEAGSVATIWRVVRRVAEALAEA